MRPSFRTCFLHAENKPHRNAIWHFQRAQKTPCAHTLIVVNIVRPPHDMKQRLGRKQRAEASVMISNEKKTKHRTTNYCRQAFRSLF